METLTLLQNKVKRDPKAYIGECKQILRSYEAQLEIFFLSPPSSTKDFGQLVRFLAHVAHLYPSEFKNFTDSVLSLLSNSYENIEPNLRRVLFNCLQLLRNKQMLSPIELIKLCLNLFQCKDKKLREIIYYHVINDTKNMNKDSKNNRLNTLIRAEIQKAIQSPDSITSKSSLQLLIDLYQRQILTDSQTVNIISWEALSFRPKNVAIALHFFLNIDDKIDSYFDQEEDETIKQSLEQSTGKSFNKLERNQQTSCKTYAKKTRARLRKQKIERKALKKARMSKLDSNQLSKSTLDTNDRFSAIEILNDPQTFSEKLFKKLKESRDHFELRLLMMNLISRIIGYHKLIILSFYGFLQKYLQPHQRHVTMILAYLIQASHELVPTEFLESILKHIANNFVNDHSGPELMAVGINTCSELIIKVPLLTNCEGIDDLLQDLVLYKNFKKDKSVVIAARSLINMLRKINPSVLQRKERGKFHISTSLLEYGQYEVAEGVEGAELLQILEKEAEEMTHKEYIPENISKDTEKNTFNDENLKENETCIEEIDNISWKEINNHESLLEKSKKIQICQKDRIDANRILTDEDFARIKKLKAKVQKEKFDPYLRRKRNKVIKNNYPVKNSVVKKLEIHGCKFDGLEQDIVETDDPFDSDESSSEESENDNSINDGSFHPSNLEGYIHRCKKELSDRLASIYSGRAEATNFSKLRSGGSSNQEKQKNKLFLMVTKGKKKIIAKQRSSLHEQQKNLRTHLKNLENTHRTLQKIRRRNKNT